MSTGNTKDTKRTKITNGQARRACHGGAWLVAVWLITALTPLVAQTSVDERAPDSFKVRIETTRGVVALAAERALAPHGADRFYTLVRARYFDDSRFFRVVPGRWAQFGIAGDPTVATAWRSRTIPDDPPRASNTQGAVAFAFAEKNGRATQIFINLADNSGTLDAQGFAPFARVIEGMDVVLALNGEYGEASGGGLRAGKQDPMFREGNAWLDRGFPRLDRIVRATIVADK